MKNCQKNEDNFSFISVLKNLNVSNGLLIHLNSLKPIHLKNYNNWDQIEH